MNVIYNINILLLLILIILLLLGFFSILSPDYPLPPSKGLGDYFDSQSIVKCFHFFTHIYRFSVAIVKYDIAGW